MYVTTVYVVFVWSDTDCQNALQKVKLNGNFIYFFYCFSWIYKKDRVVVVVVVRVRGAKKVHFLPPNPGH